MKDVRYKAQLNQTLPMVGRSMGCMRIIRKKSQLLKNVANQVYGMTPGADRDPQWNENQMELIRVLASEILEQCDIIQDPADR